MKKKWNKRRKRKRRVFRKKDKDNNFNKKKKQKLTGEDIDKKLKINYCENNEMKLMEFNN